MDFDDFLNLDVQTALAVITAIDGTDCRFASIGEALREFIGDITINVGQDGKTYAWLLSDDGGFDVCVDVDTLSVVDAGLAFGDFL